MLALNTKKCFAVVLSLSFFLAESAWSLPTQLILENDAYIEYFDYAIVSHDSLTPKQVIENPQLIRRVSSTRFTPISLEKGYYDFWLYSEIQIQAPGRYYLSARAPIPGEFWFIQDNKVLPSTEIRDRYLTYGVDLQAGPVKVILRAFSNNSPITGNLPLVIMTEAEASSKLGTEMMIVGMTLGLFVIMVLYNLGMFLLFRKAFFLWYCLYCLCIIYVMCFSSGLIELEETTIYIYHTIIVLTGFSVVHLVQGLIIDQCHPWLGSLLKSIAWLQLGFLVLQISGLTTSHNFVIGTTLFCIFVSIIACINALVRGSHPATYLVIGWSCAFTAVLVYFITLNLDGYEANGWLVPISFCLEVSFFSFAMGQHVRDVEQSAHKKTAHAFSQLKKVFYPHQISAIKEGRELEQTMPTHAGHGCVICFDIVGSTQISHPDKNDVFRDLFISCHEIMARNYNGFEQNAHRIKEMGDGFICSIGYPFKVQGGSIQDKSVELALGFYKAMLKVCRQKQFPNPIECGIGIAEGELRGYYPEAGPIEYDIFGRGIVLAARYESIRKALRNKLQIDGSLIIVQEAVYQALSYQNRKLFRAIMLEQYEISIRDDADAKMMYVCELKNIAKDNQDYERSA
ncbi:7TM diverse intracellular signaling domain-containing protein [Pseudobacteriovorax antillogorgiicola]|uniref:Adenylate cyclase, class 3 n=1 Tax=Pseudobacteriovorax antillogorgiicola TaxID=1513793 RepID=A0A1Y6CEW2_9BACT|nr:7TM diverse intracellular signaling domain-containing protein [Pseudobacteriovorax antillogorgiicola]TCS49083.1 class 3 adenylate cyclase [Pseudobacteriovorax antillogorgiicola]SMF51991.1 Adenylate cyclase, class 3 [Pseudobacteriovorax antillogorgiicola]